MLDTLITSRTRVKLLLRFFLNSNESSYLRNLETEFGESSNAIRVELNRFSSAGLLHSYTSGNRKYYKANQKHPLYSDINSILLKHVGIDKIIDHLALRIGQLRKVFLTGNLARGKEADVIDLIFVGTGIDSVYLQKLAERVEKMINRKLRYLVYLPSEFEKYMETRGDEGLLLVWSQNPT